MIRALLLSACCCWWAAGAQAQSIEPAPDWKSADTAHFRINYREALRAQAERVGRAAERAYPRITRALGWEPRGKTEILLIDQYDLPNGFATPLPYDTIGVFLAPPDDGELLDNSDWLDLLLTHEFTHIVHLDKVRGASATAQSVLGRNPFLFPNLFQPTWAIEGLAVFHEGDAATGRGRLKGPVFEAFLRAESQRGFLSLAEINANGRALPPSKAYLYGAYFFDFLSRRYGPQAVYQMVERYSGNLPLWPRLHTAAQPATGKTLDELWAEFLVDLTAQVQQRAEATRRVPETVGAAVAGPLFDIDSLAVQPDGSALAVLDDGLGPVQLVRVGADGLRTPLATVNRGAQVDVALTGQVLIAQPDVCNWRYLVYDLYRLQPDGTLHQLTDCARLRRAVQVGEGIAALQQSVGRTRLVMLDAQGQNLRALWEPEAEVTLVDLAASPDGRQLSVVTKRAGAWRIEQFDLNGASLATPNPRVVLTHDAPLHALQHGPAGLEFLAVRDGVFNLWRLDGNAWVRLTHTRTRVTAHSGTQPDGALWLATVAAGGAELRRMAATPVLERVAAAPPEALPAAVSTNAVDVSLPPLGAPVPYSPLHSMWPRTWWPLATADRGLTAYGASTFGADALGWHQYAAALQVETSQREWLGSLQYLYRDTNLFTLQRSLTARTWTGSDEILSYDRNTRAQWLSLVPWVKQQRTVMLGVGAALDRSERIDANTDQRTATSRDEQLLALLADYDSRGSNWWSEGSNRGQRATLLYETYRPFARDEQPARYDGAVARLDWRGFVPLGRSVLALRHTEARASGRTERFQLGGAVDPQLQLGIVLNNRDVTLRGYRGDESNLRGANARVTTLEWRVPLADIDRHAMVPAVGVNRLSGAVFFDIGGAWDQGHRPEHYRRGVGVELLAELKLLYSLGFELRAGVARALDDAEETRGYLTLGRPF